MNKVITRFAPSPTGELHIGGARTALFSYLFAKSKGGEFLLRIEDTDRKRSIEGSVEKIIDSLNWLGIKPDNKPIIQSERLDIYKKYTDELLNSNKAYFCTCSRERLDELREGQRERGEATKYDGYCRNKKLKEGVVRMKMPEREVVVDDLVRGKVKFNAKLIDDQIILKSDGYPTYHLASVVDDHLMNVTHVIRAEEWLSSTPKHLILYEAFGWDKPAFVHLPMILGSDKKKLSKRHGATSIEEYRKDYLPEALINSMVFLGWNPKNDNLHYLTLDKLIQIFNINNINKSPAIFDIVKLDDYNRFYSKEVQ